MALRKPAYQPDESEPWLISYADLVSLLLGFFIILLASSTPNELKRQQLVDALGSLVGETKSIPEAVLLIRDLSDVMKDLTAFIHERHLEDQTFLRMTDRGIELTAAGELLFASGRADVTEGAAALLGHVATLMKETNHLISVEGHTDEVPIKSAMYPSNWELSSARASSVVRFFIDRGIDTKRLTAVGYAHTRPMEELPREDIKRGKVARLRYLQALAKTRATNRRVVLVFSKAPGVTIEGAARTP